jgi:hypothetical protein
VSAANAAAQRSVTAAAEITTALARFDILRILALQIDVRSLHTSVRLIAELIFRDVVFFDRGYRVAD